MNERPPGAEPGGDATALDPGDRRGSGAQGRADVVEDEVEVPVVRVRRAVGQP